ncbi:MAG: endonuclease/exonuclease/phosphatase family protein [Bacteroidota bacterium]
MKKFRYLLNGFLILAGFVLLVAISFFTYLSFTEYKPDQICHLEISKKGISIPGNIRAFNLLTWNIGYSGLGKDMDFFYDGGSRVKAPFNDYQANLNGILSALKAMDTLDFVLLQEVDREAKRSFFTDQVAIFSNELKDFNVSFAKNYDVKYIPFPLLDPMGKVLAGLASFSRFIPSESVRISSPLNFPWPKRLFFLDRCFLINRYPITKDTSLLVINIHNSAWSEGAVLRKEELKVLKKIITAEYKKGNYVIVGGDWNQNPPGFNPKKFENDDKVWVLQPPLEKDFMPDNWHWAYDVKKPSNRDVSQAYKKGQALTTVIDAFLLSPNVSVVDIRTLDFGFEYSDHNPVYLSVRLGVSQVL